MNLTDKDREAAHMYCNKVGCDSEASAFTAFLAGIAHARAEQGVSAAIKKLDGIAAVNLSEPSPGDLERVVRAYQALQERLAVAEKDYAVADAERDTLALRLAKVEAEAQALADAIEFYSDPDKYKEVAEPMKSLGWSPAHIGRDALVRWKKFKESK